MLFKSGILVVAFCGLFLTSGNDDLAGVKCIVKGDRAATQEASAEFQGGTVYFCSEECTEAFEKDTAKYEVKANHQLVLTGQYVQTGCPFSGNAANEKITTEVGGATVGFCCGGCKSKVESAGDVAAQANFVFSKVAFEKGFQKDDTEIDLKDVKCFLMPKKDASSDHSAEYRDGKVFFCCKGCAKKFAKDTTKYSAKANQQLVASGQYTQKACPISGSPVDDDQTVEVNSMTVKMCCAKCVKKVTDAADDEAKSKLVFADKAFEKGFEKKKQVKD